MEIRLLKSGYKKNDQFYQDFLNDQIKDKDEYFSDEVINLDEVPDFPMYMASGSNDERSELFLQAFNTISKYYLNTDRDIHFNEIFWHSLLCVNKRDFLIKEYPQIMEKQSDFNKIVIKDFDWENYIYKCILGAQYINDNIDDENERLRYYNLIIDNLDVYNYIIKYNIFRNDIFLIKILDIIDKYNLSSILKSKIKDKELIDKFNLGKDEIYGRRVIFEFNKSYPVVMAPMLSNEELEVKFFEYLSIYYDITQIDKIYITMNL